MANAFKRLAGVRVSVTTEVSFYTTPSSKMTVGELYICNTSGSAESYQVALVTSATAAVLGNGDFIAFDIVIPANKTHSLTIHMAAAENLRVRSVGTVNATSFIFMGNEQDT